jgi:hypothetical protein
VTIEMQHISYRLDAHFVVGLFSLTALNVGQGHAEAARHQRLAGSGRRVRAQLLAQHLVEATADGLFDQVEAFVLTVRTGNDITKLNLGPRNLKTGLNTDLKGYLQE